MMSLYSRDVLLRLVYNYNGYYSGLTYEHLVFDSELSTCLLSSSYICLFQYCIENTATSAV